MGCDIHAHVEIKVNGQWLHWNHPQMERNYDLFSRMANVRNSERDVEPISEPRGLPEDINATTKLDYEHWNGDAHSASWLSAEEVAALCDWAEARHKKHSSDWYSFEHHQIGYIFGNGWDFKKYNYEGCPEGFEDARIVFWFDN